jgi:hypothetical protein
LYWYALKRSISIYEVQIIYIEGGL